MKEHVWYDPIDDKFIIDGDWSLAKFLWHRGAKRIYLGEL